MKQGARLQAVIDLLTETQQLRATGRVIPADALLANYTRTRRYIGSKDRAAIAELFYAVLRHQRCLSWWVERLGTPASAKMLTLFAALYYGGESVETLARYAREDQHAYPALTADEKQALANISGGNICHDDMDIADRYSVPDWIATRLQTQYPEDHEALFASLLEQAPLDLRVNTLKASRQQVLQALAKEGIGAEPTPYSSTGIRLTKRLPLFSLDIFRNGWFEVQDEGSQLVARLANALPGQRVIDFCAGAGGKTLALAAQMQNKGSIFAWDIHQRRLHDLPRRLKRAGVDNVRWQVIDSEQDSRIKRHKGRADIVLVDAPCTGSGTWRRNPDLKWRTTQTDLAELVDLQSHILDSAQRLVKPGGKLVYITCSLLEEENQQQVARLLATHPQFMPEPVEESIPGQLSGGMMQLLPHRHYTDGFFTAVLRKKDA